MSIDDYNKEMEIQFGYLDQIDIESFMDDSDGTVGGLMCDIERYYKDKELVDNDFLQGFVFNRCNEEEFIEYLEKRYPGRIRITEHTYHTYSIA